MEILGREVTAVTYEGLPLLNAYVAQKPGDCKKKIEPNYYCMNDCHGRFVTARFIEKELFSLTWLVPIDLTIDSQFEFPFKVTGVVDLDKIAKLPDYNWVRYGDGLLLYFRDQHIATYNPCGFTARPELLWKECAETIEELKNKVDELHEIAKKFTIESLLDENDDALSAELDSPKLLLMTYANGGPEAVKNLEILKGLRAKHN